MTILESAAERPPARGKGQDMGSAIAIRLCVTPRRGSTKRLPKNRRDGRDDPDYARICEQVRLAKRWGGGASRCAMKPRLNGTLALVRSVTPTMMPRERTTL